MKIVFIEPKFNEITYPRINLLTAATIAKEAGHDVKYYIESIKNIDWDDVFSADLIFVSASVLTATRSYYFAGRITANGNVVVLTGPLMSIMPQDALKYATYALKNNEEDAILPLIETIKTGNGVEKVPALTYTNKDERGFLRIQNNDIIPQSLDFDKYPMPDYSLVIGW